MKNPSRILLTIALSLLIAAPSSSAIAPHGLLAMGGYPSAILPTVTFTVTNVTPTSITMSVNSTHANDLLTFGVDQAVSPSVIRQTIAPGAHEISTNLGAQGTGCLDLSAGDYTFTFTNLNPSTTYRFKYASSSAGCSTSSNYSLISGGIVVATPQRTQPTPTPTAQVQLPTAAFVADVASPGDALYILRYNSREDSWPDQPVAILLNGNTELAVAPIARYYDLNQNCILPNCASPPNGDGAGIAILYKPDSLTVTTPRLQLRSQDGWSSSISTPIEFEDLDAILLQNLRLLALAWGTPLTDGDRANEHGAEYLLLAAPWLNHLSPDIIPLGESTPYPQEPRTPRDTTGAKGYPLFGLSPTISNTVLMVIMIVAAVAFGSIVGKRSAGTYASSSAIVPVTFGLLQLHLPSFGFVMFVIIAAAVALWRRTAS